MNKKKLVQRYHAEQYLLLLLLSFAFSVAVTRFGLYITGYPQLGNSELHIAHVLWGGILLFTANILILMFANRQIRIFGALLAGVGVGLFIDEVGKFITQSNDYFYPAAAPIIYAVFLLTFLFFVISRKQKKRTPREELYHIAQQLEEVLDHDLTVTEQDDMKKRLADVISKSDEIELKNLAKTLLDYLHDNALYVTTDKDSFLSKISRGWQKFEKHYFSRNVMRIFIAVSLIALALWIGLTPLSLLIQKTPLNSIPAISVIVDENILQQVDNPFLLYALILADVILGGFLIVSAISTLIGKDRIGTFLALTSLLILISVVNLFVFYYDQFSSITIASVEFLILFMVIRYRVRFVRKTDESGILV